MATAAATTSKRFKVCTCGVSAVGKTTLLTRVVDELQHPERVTAMSTRPQTSATIGMDFFPLAIDTEKYGTVELLMWDTAGQERSQASALAPVYWRGADAIVFVFDLCNTESWEAHTTWLESAMQYCPTAPDPYVVVIGNKLDLTAAVATSQDQQPRMRRAVARAAVQTRCEALNYSYMETSAKDGTNVVQAFTQLAVVLAQRHAATTRSPLSSSGAQRSQPITLTGQSLTAVPQPTTTATTPCNC